MYNYIVAKRQNVRLEMKYMVNLLDLNKGTSQKIVVSDDLNPDLDPVQAIARVFSETSKLFTTLQFDIEPEINKPTSSRNIVVSSNMSPDPSSDLASRKIVVSSDLAPDLDPVLAIYRVFNKTSKFSTPI